MITRELIRDIFRNREEMKQILYGSGHGDAPIVSGALKKSTSRPARRTPEKPKNRTLTDFIKK